MLHFSHATLCFFYSLILNTNNFALQYKMEYNAYKTDFYLFYFFFFWITQLCKYKSTSFMFENTKAICFLFPFK